MKNKTKDEKNLPSLQLANDLTIKFPEPIEQISATASKVQKAIKEKGAYTPDGRLFINRKGISPLLSTDSKGAKIFFNNLDEEDKLENGKEQYASAESIQKELSKRIQEPRDTIQRERLKYNEACLIVARDAPELEKLRELEESKIRKELPNVKRKKLKIENIDEITGEPLVEPEVHHKDRVADNPRRALDEKNLATLNKTTHNSLHENEIETEKDYNQYKKANKTLDDE